MGRYTIDLSVDQENVILREQAKSMAYSTVEDMLRAQRDNREESIQSWINTALGSKLPETKENRP